MLHGMNACCASPALRSNLRWGESMNTKWHRETIEALGMMTKRSRIVNKLNGVVARSDDPELRKLAERLIGEILAAGTNTEGMAPKEMKIGVPTAKKALEYCNPLAYRE